MGLAPKAGVNQMIKAVVSCLEKAFGFQKAWLGLLSCELGEMLRTREAAVGGSHPLAPSWAAGG